MVNLNITGSANIHTSDIDYTLDPSFNVESLVLNPDSSDPGSADPDVELGTQAMETLIAFDVEDDMATESTETFTVRLDPGTGYERKGGSPISFLTNILDNDD